MEDQDDFDLEEVLGDFVDSASGSEVEMEEEEEEVPLDQLDSTR